MTEHAIDSEFEEQVRHHLPADVVRPVEPRYLEEPRGKWIGRAGLVAAPRSVDEVATLVQLASDHAVPVVPYGGGTGLVGGQIMQNAAPLIISLERMSKVRSISPEDNVMICEAGTILADAQAAARSVDRLFPLSLAAEGTARIGGNLATNAGGTSVLRYGNARDQCLGLEAVLPDGSIWHGLKTLRKDNTGYDLRHLLIGSEGTLGIITAAALKLSPQPADTGTAILQVPTPEAALALLELARDQIGEMVSAFELISGQGLAFVAQTLPDIRLPFETFPPWSVLIEVGVVRGISAQAVLENLYEAGADGGLVKDGVIAQNGQQAADLWSVREHIPIANRRIGAVSSHDISLPLHAVPEFILRGVEALHSIADVRINCFGHMGDGNLHFNAFPAEGKTAGQYDDVKDALLRRVHDLVHEMGGSFSAEHGIGRFKVEDLERYADPAKLYAMRAIKAALDPKGIMNPGAVLRVSDRS